MKPIEPGCLAIYHDHDTFAVVTVVRKLIYTYGVHGGPSGCGKRGMAWALSGEGWNYAGGCECCLTRIDGVDPESEPDVTELPVVLGVR